MKFARFVFLVAGIYGLLVLTPLYFIEGRIARDFPPAITHPDFYYGFVGIALAWQLAFLLVASDPARYRIMMLPGILEKVTYAGALIILYLQHRIPMPVLAGGVVDSLFILLFLIAFLKTSPP
jgi:hypothetical protein